MFEALYLPMAKGESKVYIFNRNVNNVSEEIAFLGELTVRVGSLPMSVCQSRL